MTTVRRWKLLRTGLKSQNGDITWKPLEWQKCREKLSMCSNGFHCSLGILQALRYVNGEILAEVEVQGNNILSPDKECWSEMRIIRAWKWTKKDSVNLAILAAELVLPNFEIVFPKDNRPKKAIEAAKNYLKTLAGPVAAMLIAVSAGNTAALAAWSAARSAATSVVGSAAESKIEKWLVNNLTEMEEIF